MPLRELAITPAAINLRLAISYLNLGNADLPA
jgi:hypothetical protein